MDKTQIKQIDPEIIEAMRMVDYPFYEQHMLDFIASLNLKGTAVDVGAHVGNHTVYFATLCNFDSVEAFEPNPDAVKVFKENTQGLANVVLREIAIGSKKNNTAELSYSNGRKSGRTQVNTESKVGKITCLKLDNIHTANMPVSLIKIDVEGMEIDVLKGATALIHRNKPHLFIEHFGDPNDLLQYLPQGYKVGHRFNGAPTYHYYHQP